LSNAYIYLQDRYLTDCKFHINKWRDKFIFIGNNHLDEIDRFIINLVHCTDNSRSIQDIFIKLIQQCKFENIIDNLNKNTQEIANKYKQLNQFISNLLEQIKLIIVIESNKCIKFNEIIQCIESIICEIKTNFGSMSYTYYECTLDEIESDNTNGIQKTDYISEILDKILERITIFWYNCSYSVDLIEEEYNNLLLIPLNGALNEYDEYQKKLIINQAALKVDRIYKIFSKKVTLFSETSDILTFTIQPAP
jgi:hypothetical protein